MLRAENVDFGLDHYIGAQISKIYPPNHKRLSVYQDLWVSHEVVQICQHIAEQHC